MRGSDGAQGPDKYKQLIKRMQNRRNKMNENDRYQGQGSSPRGNYNQLQPQSSQPKFARGRVRPADDFVLKSSPAKPDIGRLPNSAKHDNNQPHTRQQFFKNTNGNYAIGQYEAQDPPDDKRITKQFQNLLYNPQKNFKGSGKVESSGQYERLHQKLDNIQNKIAEMKSNLQKKKEQKRKLLESKKKGLVDLQLKTDNPAGPLRGFITQVPEHKQLHTFHKNPYSPNHSVYYVSELTKAYKDQKSLAREHLLTSLQVLKILESSKRPSDQQMLIRRVDLPRRKGYEDKKSVVFDLDETLIHCNENLQMECDVKLPITFPTGEVIEAGINIRPHCRQILESLSKNFEIIVFTASHSCYASVVLNHLDPNSELIHHRLFREHCHATPEGIYVKDLRIINRELCNMVLVDNAAYSYAFQVDNGIPIMPYYHGDTDYELKALQRYIQLMVMSKDVRNVNRKTFKFHKYPQYYDQPQKLVEQLYITHH